MLSPLGVAPPISQHAYPIYTWLQLWARARREGGRRGQACGRADADLSDRRDRARAALFHYATQIQTSIPPAITLVEDGAGKVVGYEDDAGDSVRRPLLSE
jgi:hypothetical protein